MKAEMLEQSTRAEIRSFIAITFIFFLTLITSCSSKDRVEGFIHFRLNHDPSSLDPAMIVDVTGGAIAAKLFNGLVRLGEGYEVIPDIAETWEVDSRGTTYTFHLKKGILFHNNREVKALDFKYSFERVLAPGARSPNGWVFEKIAGSRDFMEGTVDHVAGLEVLDPMTLRIRLDRPFSPFLYLLTMTAAYVVPREVVEQPEADFSSDPIGTGPFRLRDWRHNDRLILDRSNDHFGGRPHVAGIVYRIIPEDLTAVTEFELGNLDLLSVPASEYRRFLNSGQWRSLLVSEPGINTYYLGFNCSRPPFNNAELRLAVAHAIDREKVLRTYYENRGTLASGPIPEPLRAWTAPVMPSYDPAAASAIIRRLGLKGKTINFYVTADQEVTDIAEIIQSYLRTAGLTVAIKQLEWSSYKAALNKGEEDIFWISWWVDYPDPENFLYPLFHSANHGASGNRTWYTNFLVDQLIEQGQRTRDRAVRDRAYGDAERLIVQDAPWVPFWHKADITVRQPWVRNFRSYPIYSMDKGLEVAL